MSAASARTRFKTSSGTDPLFRLVDGATCPPDDVSTLKAKREAYKLVIEKGLIRIGLALPKAPVNFYDQHFSIGFTDQQKEDLVNFLNTL